MLETLGRLSHFALRSLLALPHALLRAKFVGTMAQQERRGIPVDLPLLSRIRDRWQDMRLDLVRQLFFGRVEVIGALHVDP